MEPGTVRAEIPTDQNVCNMIEFVSDGVEQALLVVNDFV
jgi:hypothetical protein